MKLWLLRHAHVPAGAGLCYGVTDLAADAQATRSAALAFSTHPRPGSPVVCSPLLRCRQMADALTAPRPDLRMQPPDPRLCEMDFGEWEMHPWERIPREQLDAWVADFGNLRFGGRESAQAIVDRVAEALRDARARPEPEMVWITHAGVMRAVQFLQGGQQRLHSARDWPEHAPEPGGWTVATF